MIIGNSDGGGWEITPQGIRPIPPWNPEMVLQFKALAALANAQHDLANKKMQELLAPLTEQLGKLVVEQIEDTAGSGAVEGGFFYDGPEGGVFCGSTGQPPFPIPPRRILSDLAQLMAGNLLETQRLRASGPALQEADGG